MRLSFDPEANLQFDTLAKQYIYPICPLKYPMCSREFENKSALSE